MRAKAYEQMSDPAQAVAAYRRIYFFAPASAEAAEAAGAIPRLNSTLSPAHQGEALTRAQKLFAAKRFSEAYDAYTNAVREFPGVADGGRRKRTGRLRRQMRGRFPEATAALNTIPTSSEARAEAMFNLALSYGRAKQWAQARSTTDELRRGFPASQWTMRAYVQLGQLAEGAEGRCECELLLSRGGQLSFPATPKLRRRISMSPGPRMTRRTSPNPAVC
jgi:tetratricopeptide (TPR) repeat protein